MPRAKISSNAIAVAKPGYDANTAAFKDMVFSPQHIAMRLVFSGYLTVAASPTPGTWYLDNLMDRAIFTYPAGTGFTTPPLVFASGVIDSNNADISQLTYSNAGVWGGGFDLVPRFSIESYVDRFELYVAKGSTNWGIPPRTWKYFVFANTMV